VIFFLKHIERMRYNKRSDQTLNDTDETYIDVIELLVNKPIGDDTKFDGRGHRNSLLKTSKKIKRVKKI